MSSSALCRTVPSLRGRVCRTWSRLVSQCASVLLHGAVGDPRLQAHGVPAHAGIKGSAQPLFVSIAKCGTPEAPTIGARSLETGLRPLTDLFALELCKRGKRGKENVADEFV